MTRGFEKVLFRTPAFHSFFKNQTQGVSRRVCTVRQLMALFVFK